ncbi:hypothetical protein FOA52_007990 [Chlamydomonas sp. UWO 241]|nr:hypothetical protein FOA52_007990 [Chlamydomonas sp. UWO 241]
MCMPEETTQAASTDQPGGQGGGPLLLPSFSLGACRLRQQHSWRRGAAWRPPMLLASMHARQQQPQRLFSLAAAAAGSDGGPRTTRAPRQSQLPAEEQAADALAAPDSLEERMRHVLRDPKPFERALGINDSADEVEEIESIPGHRGADDQWLLERRVCCCACGRGVLSSDSAKTGRRCGGCRRWFHDAPGCTPKSDAPSLSAPNGTHGAWFHCDACRGCRASLRALALVSAEARHAALAAAPATTPTGGVAAGSAGGGAGGAAGGATAGGGGWRWPWQAAGLPPPPPTLVLLDLGKMRAAAQQAQRTLQAGQRVGQGGGGGGVAKGVVWAAGARAGARPTVADAGAARPHAGAQGGARRGSGGGCGSGGEDAQQLQQEQQQQTEAERECQLLAGPHAQRDLADAAAVFSSVAGGGAGVRELAGVRDSILEDCDYVLLVRDGGDGRRPLAALSLAVFGPGGVGGGRGGDAGHALVRAVATFPAARRNGHCAALLAEARRVLAVAGVPTLVIMYPEPGPGDGDAKAVEHAFSTRLGFSELELSTLAGFKAVPFPEYHRDLTRHCAFLAADTQLTRTGPFGWW